MEAEAISMVLAIKEAIYLYSYNMMTELRFGQLFDSA